MNVSSGRFRTAAVAAVGILVSWCISCATVPFPEERCGSTEDSGTDAASEPAYNLAYLINSLVNPDAPALLTYSEGYFIETPWFGVTAIILQVRKGSERTRIIVPESEILVNSLRNDANVLVADAYHGSGVKFRLSVGVHTGEFAPFLEHQLVDEFLSENN